jgi:hypothetical protein
LPKPKVSVLLSFPYFGDRYRRVLDRQDPAGFRVMVDSGAFSAWNKGKPIDMDEYVAFIRSLPSEWDLSAIQLDVIGDPKATLQNFLRMCDLGVDTIPVFTRGASLADRDTMYEHAPLVAVGGLVSSRGYLPYMRHFMETNDGRPVHWLGYVSPDDMKRYHPESVDSSSIANGQRWGMLSYYAGGGHFRNIQHRDFARAMTGQVKSKPFDTCVRSMRALRFTAAEVKRLGQEESWWGDVARSVDAPRRPGTTGTGFVSFASFVAAVAFGIDVERNIGTRVYHAMAAMEHLEAVFTARDFLLDRGVYGWATRTEEAYA